MCLFPKEQRKIAEKPITVFKVIGKEKKYLFGLIKRWYSPVYETEVPRKYGKILIGCKNLDIKQNLGGENYIEAGYHTYESQVKALDFFAYNWYWSRILDSFACDWSQIKPGLIPRGAEYCEGEHGDLVSNQLILFENLEKLEKYVLKN